MKKLGIGLLALVLVLVAAVLIGPSFVDWNAHKGRIAAEVRERTGRDLTIEGDVSLAILPTPALSVEGLKLANLPDGSAPTMVELESLRIRVALLPLLGGDVQVERVSLVKPVILAEVLADGRRNWEFVTRAAGASQAADEDGAPGADGGLPGGFRLDSFTIDQGTVIYRDAVRGISERIEELDAEIAAESLEGPFLIRGAARVRDTATRFDVSLGRLVEDGATPLNLGLTLSEAQAKVQFGGALSLHGESSSLRGSFKAEGPDLATAAATVPGGPSLPPVLAKPFSVEADVSADSQSVSAAELTLRLGEIAAEGELQVALGPLPDVQLRLAATQINLDRLLASAAAQPGSGPGAGPDSGSGEGSGGAPQPAAAAGPPAGLPDDLTANVQLSVDALVYRDQVVRQALADLTLSEGRLEVRQALALLPGGSDASLTGTLASPDDGGSQGLRFDGRAELASDNLRGMLEWLGADLSAVPPERLRKMSLTTRIGATAEQLTASEIDLRVDLSRATGGVVVALRERPGLGIGLSVDRVNLDAYLPSEETPGAGGAPAEEAQPDGAGRQANDTPAAGPLERFDANLDLRLGSLTYRGVALGDLRLDATLAQGALTVREARVGNLSGGSARFAGELDDLSTAPQVDGTVALEVGDPVRVGRLAGIEGDIPGRIGAFELGGTVSGGAQELGFDLELAALDGNFGFAGSAAPLAAPPSFDVRVSAEHGELAGLLRALAPELALGSGLGGLEITARAAGNPGAITVSELSGTIGPAELAGGFALALDQSGPVAREVGLDLAIRHSDLGALAQSLAPQSGFQPGLGALDLKGRVTGSSESLQVADLSGRAGPAELSGSLGLALAGPTPGLARLELDLALRHDDLPALARRLNPGIALAPGLGGVDLEARVTGEQNRFEVTDLSGTLGPTELSGRLGLDLSGAKPSLRADLTTSVLPAAGLLAPAAAGGEAGSSARSARDAAGRWSREPIDVSALDAFNADLKLTSEALVFDKARLDKATVNLGLLDGILDLRKLSGTLFGGALSVTGKVDTRASLDVGVAVTAIELDLARLLRTVAETDRVSGPLDINATLSAHGESEAELVSSLSGDGEISGTLTVKAKAEEQVGSMLLGILGERVREIRGVTDATNLLFNAFAGTPAAVEGTFRVENGVVRTEDTLVRGNQARAVTRGNADLPRWLLDTTTDLYREGESGTPYLTVDLAGPLDSPNPRLRGQALQRQPAPQVAPSGPQPSGPGPSQPGSDAPAPGPLPQSPEDALRKGLEGLIKGLGN